MTQQFTYLLMDNLHYAHPLLCLQFMLIEVPHFGGRGQWAAYDPEIRTRPRFLYKAPTQQVSSSYV